MKGDFSRFTFDPTEHYTGVLHQQGRVWLDSDWNEDVLERLALLQRQLIDVVGINGVPSPGTAFRISPGSDPNNLDNFLISGGRCYVHGNQCALEGDAAYLSQPDLPDPPRIPVPTDGSTLTALVYLEVWQRLITYLEDDSLREVALGGPDTAVRLKTVAQIKALVIPNPPANLTCAQAAQFLPVDGRGALTTLQPANTQPQSLCQLPDPANYTGRENHLYRVQIHDGGDVAGDNTGSSFHIALSADASSGATSIALATALTANQATAALRSSFITIADNSGVSERIALVSVSSAGNSLSLGTPLQNSYTVSNAAAVTGGVARFKWSRDNAAFAVSVTAVSLDRTTLTLSSLGRDAATALQQGDLVEISDDASELGRGRGHLTQIAAGPDPDQFTVVLADPLPAWFVLNGATSPPSTTLESSRHLVLRRWDGVGDAASAFDAVNTPGMNLGDGVNVQFSGSDLRTGDYWNFTARSADGSIQALTNSPPAGITRHRAPLAIVTWGPPPKTSPPSSPPGGVAMQIQDCRNVFPALINFPQVDKGVHITSLVVADPSGGPSTQLINDTNIQVNTFGGIDVLCDDIIDPVSISRPTCFLTADFPIDATNQGVATAYFRMVLAGNLSVNGGTISWRPLPQTASLLNQLIASNQADRGVLTELTLRGNFIWSQNDPTSFLDGETFGGHTKGSNNVSLTLPSGDRRRGGDFSMWFWIVAAPSVATSITAAPAQIFVNDTSTLTVTLSAAAPAGSNAVQVASSNPQVAAVPSAAIAVASGATSVSFTVTGKAVGNTNISATFPSAGGQTVAVTLVVQALPVLTGQLALNPSAIFIGAQSTGTVTLSGPAPSAGMVVTLASNNVAIATVPANVSVPAGSSSANFTVTGLTVGTATITASLSGVTLSALITVRQRPKLKEVKEIKDGKEKELVREKVEKIAATEINRVKTFVTKSIATGKTPDITASVAATNGTASAVSSLKVRAFIRPEERPAVEDLVLNSAEDPL